MNYQIFLNLWLSAMREANFYASQMIGKTETLDLNTMERRFRCFFIDSDLHQPQKLSISTEFFWVWDASLSSRYETTEEDMLMQIYGDFGKHTDTERPWLRLDTVLYASPSYEEKVMLPLLDRWQDWMEVIRFGLYPLLTDSRVYKKRTPLKIWHTEPQAVFELNENGEILLKRVKLEIGQLIQLPRNWDDPEKHDPDPEKELKKCTSTLYEAVQIWKRSFDDLFNEELNF